MTDCIFCKIASKEIDSQLIYEDDLVVAFEDLNPQAPIHLLIIPKEHIVSAADIDEDNSHIIARIFEVISQLGRELELEDGYRIVNNCGKDGGQTVDHIHFHMLGERKLNWPPG